MPVLQSVTSDKTESPSFPSLPSPQLVNPDDPVSELELTKCSRYLHYDLTERTEELFTDTKHQHHGQ